MTPEQWDALTAEARQRAFKMAGVTTADLLNDVWLQLDDAIARGQSFAEFKGAVLDSLEANWGGTVKNPGARVETIFRTNLANAFSAGAYELRSDPVVMEARPYDQYRAIGDARTRPEHRRLDGTVRPADDPWWDTHTPPLGFNCRCRRVPLTEDEARAEGITRRPPRVEPDEGFGRPARSGAWQPDLSQYPPAIRAQLERRLIG